MRSDQSYKLRRRKLLSLVLNSGVLGDLRRLRHAYESGMSSAALRHMEAQAGDKLCKLLIDMGPTYIKFGQMLSTRQDIIPQGIITALQRLQDDVPPQRFDLTLATVDEALGGDHTAFFERIEETPIASASIAQAHMGVLKDGRRVCIKVQRTGIEQMIRDDLDIIARVLGRLNRFYRLTEIIAYDEVLEAFRTQLADELDFTRELNNLNTFRKLNAQDRYVHAPAPFEALSAKRILTMEYEDEPSLGEAEAQMTQPELEELARRLIYSFSNQVFQDGFFHADPHPGNLLVRDRCEIVYIDFGIVGRLSRKNKYAILTMFLGMIKDSPRIVIDGLLEMGIIDAKVDLKRFEHDVQIILDKYLGLTLKEIELAELLNEFLGLLMRYRITIPGSVTMLFRAVAILEGVIEGMGLTQNILEIGTPIAQKLVRNYVSKDYLSEFVLPSLYDGVAAMRIAPGAGLDFMRKLQDRDYVFSHELKDSPENRRDRRDRMRLAGLGLLMVATAIFAGCGMVAAALLGERAMMHRLLFGGLGVGAIEGLILAVRWHGMMKD